VIVIVPASVLISGSYRLVSLIFYLSGRTSCTLNLRDGAYEICVRMRTQRILSEDAHPALRISRDRRGRTSRTTIFDADAQA